MMRGCDCVQRPPGAGNEHRQCSARLSERVRTSTFNKNSDLRLFQQDIQSLYQCSSLKTHYKENDHFCCHRSLLRFRYICLNAPTLMCPARHGCIGSGRLLIRKLCYTTELPPQSKALEVSEVAVFIEAYVQTAVFS